MAFNDYPGSCQGSYPIAVDADPLSNIDPMTYSFLASRHRDRAGLLRDFYPGSSPTFSGISEQQLQPLRMIGGSYSLVDAPSQVTRWGSPVLGPSDHAALTLRRTPLPEEPRYPGEWTLYPTVLTYDDHSFARNTGNYGGGSHRYASFDNGSHGDTYCDDYGVPGYGIPSYGASGYGPRDSQVFHHASSAHSARQNSGAQPYTSTRPNHYPHQLDGHQPSGHRQGAQDFNFVFERSTPVYNWHQNSSEADLSGQEPCVSASQEEDRFP
jgi:hypothetical protein